MLLALYVKIVKEKLCIHNCMYLWPKTYIISCILIKKIKIKKLNKTYNLKTWLIVDYIAIKISLTKTDSRKNNNIAGGNKHNKNLYIWKNITFY